MGMVSATDACTAADNAGLALLANGRNGTQTQPLIAIVGRRDEATKQPAIWHLQTISRKLHRTTLLSALHYVLMA